MLHTRSAKELGNRVVNRRLHRPSNARGSLVRMERHLRKGTGKGRGHGIASLGGGGTEELQEGIRAKDFVRITNQKLGLARISGSCKELLKDRSIQLRQKSMEAFVVR